MGNKKITVGLVACCDALDPALMTRGIAALAAKGFAVKEASNLRATPDGRMAGTPAERAAGFMEMALDDTVDVLLNATGGFGSNHMMGQLDWAALQGCGKAIIGFSDFTFMLNAWQTQGCGPSWHGPSLRQLAEFPDRGDCLDLHRVLRQAGQRGWVDPLAMAGAQVLATGTGDGLLYGGNLAIVVNSLGTPYAPRKDVPGLLFIEEICETNARLDRWLHQLALAGYFDNLQGVLVGRMTDIQDTTSRPYGFDIGDILQRHFGAREIPVVTGLACGHAGLNYLLPLGVTLRLTAGADRVTLAPVQN